MPWLIGLASLAMVVSSWCWQFALGATTHQRQLPAVAVAAVSADDQATAVTAQPPDRLPDAAPRGTATSTPDSVDAFVALVTPLTGEQAAATAPAGREAPGGGAAELATAGPRAPPQPAA